MYATSNSARAPAARSLAAVCTELPSTYFTVAPVAFSNAAAWHFLEFSTKVPPKVATTSSSAETGPARPAASRHIETSGQIDRTARRAVISGGSSSALRVFEPEAVALAHDPAEGGRRKVRGADQHVTLAVALEEPAPGGRGLLRIEVGPGHPLGLQTLDRRVDQVAGDHRLGASGGHVHAHVVGRVSGCRLEPYLVAQPEVVLDHLGAAGLDDGDHAVLDLVLRRLLVQGGPVGPLLLGHHVLGVGERRHPAPVLEARVPSDVVGVEVGAQHVVHLLRAHPGLGEALQILTARGHVPVRPRPPLVVAHAGVDHHGVVARAKEERLHRERQRIRPRIHGPAGEPPPIGRPLLGGDLREELAGVEVGTLGLDGAVDDDGADLSLQHGLTSDPAPYGQAFRVSTRVWRAPRPLTGSRPRRTMAGPNSAVHRQTTRRSP